MFGIARLNNLSYAATEAAPATYAVATAGSFTSVNEGSSLTFNVTGTNIVDGTYYWTSSNTTDFATISGSFTITSNAGSFSVTPTADLTTEGAETFTVSVRTDSTAGTIVATSSTITINDTSTTPANDAPTIPTLTFSGGGWTTSTFNNTAAFRTSALVGRRADGWHYLFGRADTSSLRLTHNDVNLNQALGFTPDLVNSASMFSTTTTRGGNTFVISSTSTSTRVSLGAVASWTGTPTQSSAPIGAIGTSISRTAGTNSSTAIAISARNGSNDTRAIAFFTSGSTLMHGKYVAAPGSNTFTNQSTTALTTGTTFSGSGTFLGAAGFTTNDGTGRWMIGLSQGTTRYRVTGGTTSSFSSNTSGSTVWTQPNCLAVTTLNSGGLAMAWDDFANSKFVAVAMAQDGNTIKARAIRWSDGTMGTENSSVATSVHQARICKVNSVNSGFGMVLITYLLSANGNKIYGKFVSVDSSTLELTVGAQIDFGFTGDSLAIGTTPGYAIDAAKDGTNWALTAIWRGSFNDGDGGGFLSTATG